MSFRNLVTTDPVLNTSRRVVALEISPLDIYLGGVYCMYLSRMCALLEGKNGDVMMIWR